MKYFSYDKDQGMLFHETAEKAKEYCNEVLSEMRLQATFDDEWPDYVDAICWGEVKQKVSAVNQSEDERCDFELTPAVITL